MLANKIILKTIEKKAQCPLLFKVFTIYQVPVYIINLKTLQVQCV